MPLNSLIDSARHNHAVQKQIIYKAPAPRYIDGDKLAEEKKQELAEQRANGDWRDCSHLKEVNNAYFCSHFMAKCACEKCNGKLPLLGEKKRR